LGVIRVFANQLASARMLVRDRALIGLRFSADIETIN
jgi:hypothetical protein